MELTKLQCISFIVNACTEKTIFKFPQNLHLNEKISFLDHEKCNCNQEINEIIRNAAQWQP